MQPRYLMLAGVVLFGTAGPVLADCASELEDLAGRRATAATGGIAKDGTTAPLQDPQAANATTARKADGAARAEPSDGGGGITKDGSNLPLAGVGGASPETAMSQQDVQAQQQGGQTAAEAAQGDADADSPLQQAQAALAAGDEAGCLKAVEALRQGRG